MLQDDQAEPTNWRKHWFVVNVLVEIPILGSMFKKKTLPGAIHAAGKCVAAIAGGTSAMMSILTPDKTDEVPVIIAKMSTSMIIGMTAGKVIYNAGYNGGLILYQYTSSKPTAIFNVANYDAEMQSINAGIERSNTEPNQLCG